MSSDGRRLAGHGGAPDGALPRDAGMTMAEILVAMVLLGLLTTMLTTTAILGIRTVDETSTRLDDAGRGESGMVSVTKWLRTAVSPTQLEGVSCATCGGTAVLAASATSVSFYANLGDTTAGPARITLEAVEDPTAPGTGVLQMVSQQPLSAAGGAYSYCDPSLASCVVTRRALTRGLVWPATSVFGYRDLAGAPMSGPSVAAADLGSISSVDVVLSVRSKQAARFRTTTAVQRVALPNVELSQRASS